MSKSIVSSAALRGLAAVLAERGALPPAEALTIFRQLLAAVRTLHAAGRTHRAIGPDTVRLDPAGDATLSAPEPVREFDGSSADPESCPPELFAAGAVRLSAEIEAARQELLRAGVALDPRRIDVYQLGALLCRMVTGESVAAYLRSPRTKSKVPGVLRPLIDRALGHRAAGRIADCDEYAAVMGELAAGRERSAETPPHGSAAGLPSNTPPGGAGSPTGPSLSSSAGLPFARLAHYRIDERIGRGGMGDVYLGFEESLQRRVAIKVLPTEFGRDEEFVRRFRAEATAAAKLTHPNIVPIYFIGQDAGCHFFAMQYVQGESLDRLLARQKRLPVDEALGILEQCLAGLGAAHQAGLTHRDVKPGNILLDARTGRALVADFGLVKTAGDGHGMTATGVILGTVDYIAPEQARGRPVDGRADLYALGVLAFQMLSGRLPFRAETPSAMIFQHAYEVPPPLREVAPNVPGPLAAVVDRLMAKDPAARHQSCEEVLEDLRRWRAGEPLAEAAGATPGERPSRVIRAPAFAAPPELPFRMEPAAPGWWSSLRDRAMGWLHAKAPEVLERLQNTGQQVDTALAEYQRRRDRLAGLVVEATESAEELAAQAQSHRDAAAAARRVENGPDQEAARRAAREREECERVAADLEAQAAEQREQVARMRLDLTKADATLGRLRSQRELLRGRLRVAEARLGMEQGPARPRRRKRLAIGAVLVLLLLLAGGLFFALAPRQTVTSPPIAAPGVDPAISPPVVSLPDSSNLSFETGWDKPVDPDGDCKFTPDKTALTIEAPGKRHDLNFGMNAPRILRNVEGDFTVEVRVSGEFRPEAPGALPGAAPIVLAGLVVMADDRPCAELGRGALAKPTMLTHGVNLNVWPDERSNIGGGGEISDAPTYLRLRRDGSRFFASFSQDGVKWTDIQTADREVNMPARLKLGVILTTTSSAPFKARFEDFRLTSGGVKPTAPGIEEKPKEEVTNSIGMKLKLIHEGKYLMGARKYEATGSEDMPQHEVVIQKPFYMGVDLVTRGQFKAFVDAEHYRTEAEMSGLGARGYSDATGKWEQKPEYTWKSPGFEQADDHPVVDVTRFDALRFCAWLGAKEGKTYELPTEEQWEYACRAGTETPYCYGRDANSLNGNANVADSSLTAKHPGVVLSAAPWDDGFPFTSPVEKFPPNPWGLYDMHGNARQLVADHLRRKTAGSGNGQPGMDHFYVTRGGSWADPPSICSSFSRLPIFDSVSIPGVGFRVMLRTAGGNNPDGGNKPDAPWPEEKPIDQPVAALTKEEKAKDAAAKPVAMKLVLIQPGKFLMGAPANEEGRADDEGPQHLVEITRPYSMGVYPVTVGQFRAFVKDTEYRTLAETNGQGGFGYNAASRKFEIAPKYSWRNPGFPQGEDQPVVNVTWDDAARFCQWLSRIEGKTYELPTEAEWEYACRAGTTTRFSCGDKDEDLKGFANLADASAKDKINPAFAPAGWDDGFSFTSPVGSFKPNPWGLYDMHGNVMQWCADRSGAYQEGFIKDPKGDDKAFSRVLRGSSYSDSPACCRSARRGAGAANFFPLATLGFRVVLRSAGDGNPRQPSGVEDHPVQPRSLALAAPDAVTAAAFSPDGKRLVVGDTKLRLWDLEHNKQVHDFDGAEYGPAFHDAAGRFIVGSIRAVSWSPDGRRVLMGGSDVRDGRTGGAAILFEADTGKVVQTFIGHPTSVCAVALSVDGSEILTAGDSPRDPRTGFAVTTPGDPSQEVTEVRRWDVATGKELGRYHGPTAPTHSVAFSPDGKRIFAAGSVSDPAVYSWDVDNPGGLRLKFPKGLTSTYAVLTPDAGKVAHLTTNWAFYIYDLTDGNQLNEICHSGPLAHIPAPAPTAPVWSRGGRFVACSSWQYPKDPGKAPIYIVDAASGKVVWTLEGHRIETKALAISDDGRLIFSSSADGNRLWEVTSKPGAGDKP